MKITEGALVVIKTQKFDNLHELLGNTIIVAVAVFTPVKLDFDDKVLLLTNLAI